MNDLIVGVGTVDNVLAKTSPKNGKRYYSVRIDGIAGTTWDLGLGSKLIQGVTGKYVFKQDGEFKNLVSFEAGEAPAGGAAQYAGSPRVDDTSMRIARSHALTTAVTLGVATAKPKDTAEALLNAALDMAEKVREYTVTGRNPYQGPEDILFKEV